MPVEQSERRSVNLSRLKPEASTVGPLKGYYGLERINSAAIRDRSTVFKNLIHHVSEDNLIQAFRGLDGSKAVGIDQVTKRKYAQNLLANIQALQSEIRRGGWRPRPSRQVLIPKPSGGKRPLAIGCLENKIVQSLMAKILEAIYEPRFHRHSYGFRPGRNPHQALGGAYSAINKRGKHTVVVEMDIEKFFNHIDHDKLWLNRRSQKRSYSWQQFVRKLMFNPLPKPPLGYEQIDVTSEHSSELKHNTKSRMRKSRTSGSVRSSGRQRPLFT
jgi:retron-type reverse transcriptase